MQLLTAKNAEDMAARELNLPFQLPVWVRDVQIFQDAEAEGIIGREPSAPERQAHKEILAMLTAQGEFLVNRFREQGVPEQAGMKLADVEAILEALYDKQRVFFGGMSEQRRAQVLEEVFGAS